MSDLVEVQIPDDWIQKFLTVAQLSGTQLGGWIAVRAGRFRPLATSRLRCELEILCRHQALCRPLDSALETEALALLAQLPVASGVQVGFLSDTGEFQPLLGGEPGLPGTAARIDVLKEVAACVALEQFIPDSTRRGLVPVLRAATEATIGSWTPYALPNCISFACRYNRETAPDDPFQFLDLLLQEPPPNTLDTTLATLAEAARVELATKSPGANDTGRAEDGTAARQLYGIAAHTTALRPALLHGIVRWIPAAQARTQPPASEIARNKTSKQTRPTAQVLVCTHYLHEYEVLLKQVDVLIEEDAGRLSAGALAARRHGIPCVNGIGSLSRLLHEGSEVFVDQRQGIITVPLQ